MSKLKQNQMKIHSPKCFSLLYMIGNSLNVNSSIKTATITTRMSRKVELLRTKAEISCRTKVIYEAKSWILESPIK